MLARRCEIRIDRYGDVGASDITAAYGETYEIRFAASATGPTASTLGPATGGDSLESFAEKVKSVQRDLTAADKILLQTFADKVASLQRDYFDVRERWAEHCGTHFEGIKDLYKDDEASLRFFYDLHSHSCGTCDRCNP